MLEGSGFNQISTWIIYQRYPTKNKFRGFSSSNFPCSHQIWSNKKSCLNQRLGDGCVWVPKTKSWPLPTSPFFISRRKDGVPSIVGKRGKMFPIHFKYVPFWKLFDHLQNYIDGTFTNPEKDPEKGRCLMLKFTNRLFRWCQENHQLYWGMLCRENEIKHQKLKPTLL